VQRRGLAGGRRVTPGADSGSGGDSRFSDWWLRRHWVSVGALFAAECQIWGGFRRRVSPGEPVWLLQGPPARPATPS
jgi:hypothetical protein